MKYHCIFVPGMNDTRHHNNQNLFSKWLLIAALFLSFFTFGLPAGQSSIKPQARQTTLLVCNPTRFIKSITFNKALRHLNNKHAVNSFLAAFSVNLIILHSRLVNTRLEIHSRPNLTWIQNGLVYHVKTNTANTGDDLTPSLG